MLRLAFYISIITLVFCRPLLGEEKNTQWSEDKLYVVCDFGGGMTELAQTVLSIERMSPAEIAKLNQLTQAAVDYEKLLNGSVPKAPIDEDLRREAETRYELLNKSWTKSEVAQEELRRMVSEIAKELNLEMLPDRAETIEDMAKLQQFYKKAKRIRVEGLVRAKLLERLAKPKKDLAR